MKKFNYLLIGLAGLTLASCSQEDVVAPGSGDGNVAITVKLPGDLGTRANFGDGTSSKVLKYAVYTVNGETPTLSFEGTGDFGTSTSTTLNLNLLNKQYKIAFFAQSTSSTDVYTFSADNATINVDYEKMTGANNNADAYDCFYNFIDVDLTNTNATTSFNVDLYRPVAQVNWGTNDIGKTDELINTFGQYGEFIMSSLSVNENTPLPTSLNIFSGDVESTFSGVLGGTNFFPIPPKTQKYPVDSDTYKYVAIQYILIGAPDNISGETAEAAIYDFTLNINNNGDDEVTEYTTDVVVANAPLKANYQTNIYGSLLSNNASFNIEVIPGFAGVSNLVLTADDFATALANGGEIGLGADVSTNAPLKIENDTELELNGHTLTISSKYLSSIKSGSSVSIKNGNLQFNGQSGASYDLTVGDGASLTLDGVTFNTTAAGINAQSDHAGLIINNSTFTGPYYIISSNASGTTGESGGDYGKDGEITLTNSTFNSTGGTPLMNNVPETITATGCTFNGKIQCAFIRGGNASFDDCTFNLTHTMDGNPYRLKTWGQGNAACIAPIVGGNLDLNVYAEGKEPSYNYPTTINLTGVTTINIDGANAAYTPAINLASKDKNTVTFNYETLDVTYANGVTRADGYYEIEFVTTGITVNGNAVTTETPGYIGTK